MSRRLAHGSQPAERYGWKPFGNYDYGFFASPALGDLDGDGSINISDFMLIYWYVMDDSPRWWPTADIDELAADMNGDGSVNVIDILLLLEALREEAENN